MKPSFTQSLISLKFICLRKIISAAKRNIRDKEIHDECRMTEKQVVLLTSFKADSSPFVFLYCRGGEGYSGIKIGY